MENALRKGVTMARLGADPVVAPIRSKLLLRRKTIKNVRALAFL